MVSAILSKQFEPGVNSAACKAFASAFLEQRATKTTQVHRNSHHNNFFCENMAVKYWERVVWRRIDCRQRNSRFPSQYITKISMLFIVSVYRLGVKTLRLLSLLFKKKKNVFMNVPN